MRFLALWLLTITPNKASRLSSACSENVRRECWPPIGKATCPEHLAAKCIHCDECKNRAKPQLFKAYMFAARRHYIEVPDDGNCLFYAVAAAYRSHMMKAGIDKQTLYQQGVNGREFRAAAAAIIKDRLNNKSTANTRNLPDVDWDIIFLAATVVEGRSREEFLQDLETHAAPGQRGSRYWGGDAALAALAVVTNARLIVYNAMGELPNDSLKTLTTPKRWDVELTLWFNKDDGTGRGGTHYDAFTESGGPDPVLSDGRW